MAKPRILTRASKLLENALRIQIQADGVAFPFGDPPTPPQPGIYIVIPIADADAMVSALAREDARETRPDPSLRPARKRRG